MKKLWPLALMIVLLIGDLFVPLLYGDTRGFWQLFPPLVFGIVLACVAFVALFIEQREHKKPGA